MNSYLSSAKLGWGFLAIVASLGAISLLSLQTTVELLDDSEIASVRGGGCYRLQWNNCGNVPFANCQFGANCQAAGGPCPGQNQKMWTKFSDGWDSAVDGANPGKDSFETWEPIPCFVAKNCSCRVFQIGNLFENKCAVGDNFSEWFDYNAPQTLQGNTCPPLG